MPSPRVTRLPRLLGRHPVLTGLVVVLLAAGGGLAYWLTGGSSSAAAAPDYRLVAAATGTIRQTVSASGTIAPAVQDALTFGVSGRVTAVQVTQGQKVTAGQPLATIDPATLQASLAQANASLASDQARLTSDQNAGASDTQIAADNAAITAAQGAVQSAQTALGQATLTSPVDGVVAAVNLTVGQQVGGSGGSSAGSTGGSSSAGSTGGRTTTGTTSTGTGGSTSSSSTSTAQVLVVGTDSWVVNTSVDDTQVSLLAVGDQAQIVPDGSTATVYGKISSIGLIASSSSGVASFPVTVAVTGNPGGLLDGATAAVSLIYKQLSNVLVVPTAAVHSNGTGRYVTVMDNGKQVSRTVEVGASGGGQTQIMSGLNEGDEVVEQVTRPAGTGTTNRTGTTRTGTFPGGGGGAGGGFGGAGGGGFGGAGGGGFGGSGTGNGGR